jgi:Di-N-acetylchitobiase
MQTIGSRGFCCIALPCRYGYQYPCLEGTLTRDRYCPIRLVPFRGVDCSDAAGWEVPFANLMDEFYRQNSTQPLNRDFYMDASYFNSQKEGKDGTMVVHQSWFDDPTSLRHKYSFARSVGLKGVGPYIFGDLNPTSQPVESSEIWSSFDAFFNDDDEAIGVS